MHIQQGSDQTMYYAFTNYLGSVLEWYTEEGSSYTSVASYNYDAWGRLRNPNDWTYNNVLSMSLHNRGYTGHEHIAEFSLINMNGRVYDPVLGRFLSPDNYVQMPDFTQNFNRYTYALNTPLIYTDPTGEVIDPISIISIGIVLAWTYFNAAHENRDPETGEWAWDPSDWAYFEAGGSVNSDGDLTAYAGVGSQNAMPSLSYHSEHGFGY